MGVAYYGVLYEDSARVIVMRVSGHPFDLEEYEEAADSLMKLFEEGEELLQGIEDTSVFSFRTVYALTRAAELARKATAVEYPAAVLYLALCEYLGLPPRILSEFSIPQDKEVIVIPPTSD